jgi:hypothetical protein
LAYEINQGPYYVKLLTGFDIPEGTCLTLDLTLRVPLGAKYLVFVSSRSLKTRDLSFGQFGNFLNDKIYSYVLFNIIVNFVIQKLKNKHTFLKKPQKVAKLSKLSSLVLREREETKTKYFAP